MSLRTNRARLIALYSLCLLGIGWQYAASLCSWNLNLGWVLATRPRGNNSNLRLNRAEAHFRRAAQLRRDRVGAWIGLARLAQLRGDREGAQTVFQKALDIDRFQPLANFELAKIRSSEGNFNEAVAYYRAVGDVYAVVRLGDALAGNRPTEAERVYRDAISLQPGIRLPHTQLGRLLREEDRLEEALIEFRRALDVDPEYGWSWYLVATTCLEDGRPQECLDWIRLASDKFPLETELTVALQRLEVYARQTRPGEKFRRKRH